ncbi:MAG TPA: hypothetical protein DIW47_01765 [Bacteroidetes bacterium]|nr:hypothetical protein [Bacteroidota bacterium]
MKKITLVFLLFGFCILSRAQSFQFQMYFEDAVGNKDTITLGYDANGTALIDPSFGEVDIIGIPLDSTFDVRISNARYNQINPTFQTKKQIVADSCSGWWFHAVSIEIHSKNWPVTASWDSALFNADCREGSVFTGMSPGGWWDVFGQPSNLNRAELATHSQVTFTSNYNPATPGNLYDAYVNSTNDTIPVFWMAFGDSSLLRLDVLGLSPELNAYPNPVVDFLHLDIESDLIHEIHVVDLAGRSTLVEYKNGHIDMRTFQSGNYMLILKLTEGTCLKKKILKK